MSHSIDNITFSQTLSREQPGKVLVRNSITGNVEERNDNTVTDYNIYYDPFIQ